MRRARECRHIMARATPLRARASALSARVRPRARARRVGDRAGARTRAQGAVELASALDAVNLDLALSDAEEILGKGAFAALSLASLAFGGKVRARAAVGGGVGRWEGRGRARAGRAGYPRAGPGWGVQKASDAGVVR